MSPTKSLKKVPRGIKKFAVSVTKAPGQTLWLKDLEALDGSVPSGGGGTTNVMSTEQGYLICTDNDLEVLVTFEEERERRGHFDMIFPTKGNIDLYRPFFG
jgi:hypothetical protein